MSTSTDSSASEYDYSDTDSVSSEDDKQAKIWVEPMRQNLDEIFKLIREAREETALAIFAASKDKTDIDYAHYKQLYDYKRGKAIVLDNGTLLRLTNTILETEQDSLAKKGIDMRAKASSEINAEKKAQYEKISSVAGRRGEALEMMNSRYMKLFEEINITNKKIYEVAAKGSEQVNQLKREHKLLKKGHHDLSEKMDVLLGHPIFGSALTWFRQLDYDGLWKVAAAMDYIYQLHKPPVPSVAPVPTTKGNSPPKKERKEQEKTILHKSHEGTKPIFMKNDAQKAFRHFIELFRPYEHYLDQVQCPVPVEAIAMWKHEIGISNVVESSEIRPDKKLTPENIAYCAMIIFKMYRSSETEIFNNLDTARGRSTTQDLQGIEDVLKNGLPDELGSEVRKRLAPRIECLRTLWSAARIVTDRALYQNLFTEFLFNLSSKDQLHAHPPVTDPEAYKLWTKVLEAILKMEGNDIISDGERLAMQKKAQVHENLRKAIAEPYSSVIKFQPVAVVLSDTVEAQSGPSSS